MNRMILDEPFPTGPYLGRWESSNKYGIQVSSVAGSGMFYPGSRIRLFSIPDPNCLHPGSRIRIKEFKNFKPKKNKKKWFLSSRKYDPGCSSRIRMLTFYPSRIPDPGVKKAPDPGSVTLHQRLNTDPYPKF